MPKILIVDDDVAYSTTLQSLLKPHEWTVELVGNGKDALQLLTNFQYDFILLDWNLPDTTGLEICKRYRASGGETPIIFLTGRHGIEEKESGLDAGGDDYLTKPFDVRELLARIRTVQRRQSGSQSGRFKARGVEFDPKLRIIICGAERAQLSPTESSILECLFRHANQLYSSAKLFEAVWPSEAESSDEAVRVHMRVLRRKLSLIGSEDLIKTVRGSGYVIETDDNPSQAGKVNRE